jgi:hypothetical protein
MNEVAARVVSCMVPGAVGSAPPGIGDAPRKNGGLSHVKPKPAKAALKSLPKPRPAKAVILDLKQLPVILTLTELAALYRLSPLTIRRGLQNNTFRPLPFEKYPYRWLRDDVTRDLQSRHPKLKTRRHGFAAAKAKRQAAEDKVVSK